MFSACAGPKADVSVTDDSLDPPPVVITLPAEIDVANQDKAYRLFETVPAPGVRAVVADLTGTTFCDSAGFRMLSQVQRDTAARGAELRLAVTPGGAVSRMLHLLDFGRVLSIYPSLEAALKN